MITVKSFVFNPFSENTYVVSDETRKALVIDPGCYESHEKKELDTYIAKEQLEIAYLLNTHCHIDHVLGNDHVKSKYDPPFLIHKNEVPVLKAVGSYASNYGFAKYQEVLPDGFLSEKDKLEWGKSKFEILFLPGHAPGHVGFYNAEEKILISGDVLFERSIGRTDLPGGDMDTLIESIQKKLFKLPDDTVVYTGHGNETTIGVEKISNPFCAISN